MVAATFIHFTHRTALNHLHETLRTHVRRRGYCTRGSKQSHWEQIHVIATKNREVRRRFCQNAKSACVDRPDRVLDPNYVRCIGEFQEAIRLQENPCAVGDVVQDDRNRTRSGHCLEMRNDSALAGPKVVGHDTQRGGDPGNLRKTFDPPYRRFRVVGPGADDQLRSSIAAHAGTDINKLLFLGLLQQRGFTRSSKRDDPGYTFIKEVTRQAFD